MQFFEIIKSEIEINKVVKTEVLIFVMRIVSSTTSHGSRPRRHRIGTKTFMACTSLGSLQRNTSMDLEDECETGFTDIIILLRHIGY